MNAITPKAIISLEAYKRLNLEVQAAQQSVNFAPPPTSSVLDKKLLHNPPIPKFDAIPSYIYLYNIRFGLDARLTVEHTLYYEEGLVGEIKDRVPIDHNRVPEIVKSLVGVSGGSTGATAVSEPFGGNFRNNSDGTTKHWDRVSYLAFLIDHPNWSFCNGMNDEPVPAVFGHNGSAGGNHCFFDGAVKEIGSGSTKRSLFYCVNHMRDIKGNPPLPNESETFKYDLYTKFEFGNGFDPVILIFDPGGDNQGPPVPPPDFP